MIKQKESLIVFTLPLPPSLNHTHLIANNRLILTDEAWRWMEINAWTVIRQWEEQRGKADLIERSTEEIRAFIRLKRHARSENLPRIKTSLPEVLNLEAEVYIGESFTKSDAANRGKLALDLVAKVLGFNDKMVFHDSMRKRPAKLYGGEEKIILRFSVDDEGLNEWEKLKEDRKRKRRERTKKEAA